MLFIIFISLTHFSPFEMSSKNKFSFLNPTINYQYFSDFVNDFDMHCIATSYCDIHYSKACS